MNFKENLTILLLSTLFIILAARVKLTSLEAYLNLNTLLFIGLLILFVRPISVLVATLGSKLNWPERCFIAGVAPRGIVAAAVASLFTIRLVELGVPMAEKLVPITFLVIIVTVAFYSLLIQPMANRLNVKRQQKGVVFVGAHRGACLLASCLQESGVNVLLIDTNKDNIIAAKDMRLTTFFGNILSERAYEMIDQNQLGQLVAMTSNDELNQMAIETYETHFGVAKVFRFYPKDKVLNDPIPAKHILFNKSVTSSYFETRLSADSYIKAFKLTKTFQYEDYAMQFPRAISLCVINQENYIQFFTEGIKTTPIAGQILVSLISEARYHAAIQYKEQERINV